MHPDRGFLPRRSSSSTRLCVTHVTDLLQAEAVYPEDPTSGKPTVPSFLGFSASGDVTGQLVYANYGR